MMLRVRTMFRPMKKSVPRVRGSPGHSERTHMREGATSCVRFVDVRVSIAEVRVKSVKGRYYSSILLSGVKGVRAQHEGA